jgi:hypothetical protein
MCWVCRAREQSIYRKCDGCGKAFDRSNLQEYDIHREWGQLAEWIESKKDIVVYCENCVEAMNAYRESIRAQASETEPSVWIHYGNRNRDTRFGLIPVGIFLTANQKTIGIRCAQITYGVNATEEILQGFVYKDDDGRVIRRVTMDEIDETVRCDKCWLPLWQCNAREAAR